MSPGLLPKSIGKMGFLNHFRYRLWQFWQEMAARPLSAVAWREIESILAPDEVRLFRQFSLSDQMHSYRVMKTVREAGQNTPALLAAALLHDVGKTKVSLSVWDRVLVVLAQLLIPGRLVAWGQGEPRGWRKAFVVKEQHAAWGAEMAQRAGSSPLTVALIRRHQDNVGEMAGNEADQLLHYLQWADDQN